jgi:hypothetical protein
VIIISTKLFEILKQQLNDNDLEDWEEEESYFAKRPL